MPTFISNQAATTGANKWHTSNVKRIKTMIRDFSLVFLLLISDRRNLHRDSRRDTEQNVPWKVLLPDRWQLTDNNFS